MTSSSRDIPDRAGSRRSIAVILACHNRRELTLRALRSLKQARELFDISVVLYDDGSTDGTGEAVSAEFPDTIVLRGTGDAFWNGGMHRAWQCALELKPSAYLWLNDDVQLDPDAFARIADAWTEAAALYGEALVLVGATRNAKGELTYGGMRRVHSPFTLKFERLPEAKELSRLDTFNGNIVLATAAAVDRVGILDPGFHHALGDIDYGLRTTKAGIPALAIPGTLGVCEANPAADLSTMSLRARWRHLLRSPRGLRLGNWWRMTWRHSGRFAPLHFVTPYRKLFYPAALLRNKR